MSSQQVVSPQKQTLQKLNKEDYDFIKGAVAVRTEKGASNSPVQLPSTWQDSRKETMMKALQKLGFETQKNSPFRCKPMPKRDLRPLKFMLDEVDRDSQEGDSKENRLQSSQLGSSTQSISDTLIDQMSGIKLNDSDGGKPSKRGSGGSGGSGSSIGGTRATPQRQASKRFNRATQKSVAVGVRAGSCTMPASSLSSSQQPPPSPSGSYTSTYKAMMFTMGGCVFEQDDQPKETNQFVRLNADGEEEDEEEDSDFSGDDEDGNLDASEYGDDDGLGLVYNNDFDADDDAFLAGDDSSALGRGYESCGSGGMLVKRTAEESDLSLSLDLYNKMVLLHIITCSTVTQWRLDASSDDSSTSLSSLSRPDDPDSPSSFRTSGNGAGGGKTKNDIERVSQKIRVRRVAVPFVDLQSIEKQAGGRIKWKLKGKNSGSTSLQYALYDYEMPARQSWTKQFRVPGYSNVGWKQSHDDFAFQCDTGPCPTVNVQFASNKTRDKVWATLSAVPVLRQLVEESVYTKYKFVEQIGSGTFGQVFLAQERSTNEEYAIKIIPKKGINERALEGFRGEFDFAASLTHPAVIKMKDKFESPIEIFLVQELARGGELFDRVVGSRNGRLSEADAADIMYQLLHALDYMHRRKFIHRDLKLENIMMVDSTSNLMKLIDFGISKCITATIAKTFVGTRRYLAPEVIEVSRGIGQSYTSKCDMWSAGVVLYVMLCGRYPFDHEPGGDENSDKITSDIMDGRFDTKTGAWKSDISETARSLVHALLCVDPEKRASGATALKHPWILKYNVEKEAKHQEQLQRRRNARRRRSARKSIF